MSNAPFTCNDCTNRHPGCHDKCEKYNREKAEWERRKAIRDRDKDAWYYTNKTIANLRDANAKSRKKFSGYRKTYNV